MSAKSSEEYDDDLAWLTRKRGWGVSVVVPA